MKGNPSIAPNSNMAKGSTNLSPCCCYVCMKAHLQDSLLDAIAVAHEEVELDAGKQAQEYEHDDGIGTPWTGMSWSAIVKDKAGNERNIGVCLSKSRD